MHDEYNMQTQPGAAPGCLLRGWAKLPKVSLLLCEPSNFAPALKKSFSGGGGGGGGGGGFFLDFQIPPPQKKKWGRGTMMAMTDS